MKTGWSRAEIVALHPVRQRRGNGEIILDRK